MEIRSVALIGAGAVGSFIAYALAGKDGVDFCVVADGARKERLEREGIAVNNKKEIVTLRPRVCTPEEAKGADLLLVAVKYTALDSVLEDIRTICSPDTVVLSLLNGIDSEEKIAEVIDPAQIVYSLMRVSSERRKDAEGRDVVTFDPTIKWGVYLGEKGSPVKSARIEAVEDLFAGTTCSVYFMENILQDQWAKYASNICYNLPQAVLGVPFKAYFDSAHVQFLRDRLLKEVTRVGAAMGIEVPGPSLSWAALGDRDVRGRPHAQGGRSGRRSALCDLRVSCHQGAGGEERREVRLITPPGTKKHERKGTKTHERKVRRWRIERRIRLQRGIGRYGL